MLLLAGTALLLCCGMHATRAEEPVAMPTGDLDYVDPRWDTIWVHSLCPAFCAPHVN